ncbi:hypothetical protein BDW62DRAFT_191484 [Aspergillus aurantiobrunneus]
MQHGKLGKFYFNHIYPHPKVICSPDVDVGFRVSCRTLRLSWSSTKLVQLDPLKHVFSHNLLKRPVGDVDPSWKVESACFPLRSDSPLRSSLGRDRCWDTRQAAQLAGKRQPQPYHIHCWMILQDQEYTPLSPFIPKRGTADCATCPLDASGFQPRDFSRKGGGKFITP